MPKRKSHVCDPSWEFAVRKAGMQVQEEELSQVIFESPSEGVTKIRVIAYAGNEGSVRSKAREDNVSFLPDSDASDDDESMSSGMFQNVPLSDHAIDDICTEAVSEEQTHEKECPMPRRKAEVEEHQANLSSKDVGGDSVNSACNDEENTRNSCGAYVQSLSREESQLMMTDFEVYMAKKMKDGGNKQNAGVHTLPWAKRESHESLNSILYSLLCTGQEAYHPGYDVLDALRRVLF